MYRLIIYSLVLASLVWQVHGQNRYHCVFDGKCCMGVVYNSVIQMYKIIIMLRYIKFSCHICCTDYLTVPQGITLFTQAGKCLSSARTDAAVGLNPLTPSESLPSANFSNLNVKYDAGPFCIALIYSQY